MQTLAFVDLETTGATAAVDRITEIGIVEVDASGVREWSRLVNPGTPIPAFIQRMTGITDEMVRDAPTFDRLAAEVLDRLQGRLFIAHNARFDYGFLKNELRRAGHDFRATVLCTVKLSRRIFPEHRRHSLDALIERHALQAQGRHRALADAQLIHQFWQLLRRSRPEEELAALVKELTARPSLPAPLDPGIVDDLPDGPGVYVFYGENAVPLYVGRAKDIGKRVLSHFAREHASPRDADLARQVRRIDWTVTGGEIGAQLKETALIRQLRPTLNRQPRHDDESSATALARPHPPPWPYPGPACVREGHDVHVLDRWCYLGSARSADELWLLLEQNRPPFDRDVYRILAKAAARMVPLRPGSQP
jgi:DNA polymerase III subunit epsilon